MLQASLFDLLLNLALPVCFCMCSSRLPPGFFFQPTAAAGESCVCLQWCLWQACQTSIACCCVWSSRATPCNSMAHCQEYNLHLIMQHARCHACLLIISISCGTPCSSSPGGQAHGMHHHLQHAHYQYHACCLSAAAWYVRCITTSKTLLFSCCKTLPSKMQHAPHTLHTLVD